MIYSEGVQLHFFYKLICLTGIKNNNVSHCAINNALPLTEIDYFQIPNEELDSKIVAIITY